MSEDWTPCRFIDYREFLDEEDIVSRFGLIFDEFGSTQELLESQGLMGGGYTWHGIVESMIRKKDAALNAELNYDPEGSMFCVRSSNQHALRIVLECIRTALVLLCQFAVRDDARHILTQKFFSSQESLMAL